MSKTAFLGPIFFSSWQFSYLLFLVPEKVQSGSWQNKKLRTLHGKRSLPLEEKNADPYFDFSDSRSALVM